MPYKDPEKQKEFNREWSRRKYSDEKAAEAKREIKRAWAAKNKEHIREYQRRWYSTERGRLRQKKNKLFVKNIAVWLKELKRSLSCKLCPEDHPATLDFHHRDPSTKNYDVSRMVQLGLSPERILEEIEKCDVLCANCHRKLHWG